MKDKKGITLIALIITIIVMLILVGVTINIAINGGLFDTARTATIQTELEEIKEQLILKKAKIVADNNGNIPTDYQIATITNLDNLSQNLIDKYNSKLIISNDGTLYYTDNATSQDIVYFENAGINKYEGSEEEIDRTKAYNLTFNANLNETLSEDDWEIIDGTSMIIAFYPSKYNGLLDSYDELDFSVLVSAHDGSGGVFYSPNYDFASGEYYMFAHDLGIWKHGTIGVDDFDDLPAYTSPITITNVKIATQEEMYEDILFSDELLRKIFIIEEIDN